MNVLLVYNGYPSPIIETQLEIIQKHKLIGDKIFLLRCDNKLDNCFWNPEKKKYICNNCISKFNNAIGAIGFNPSQDNIINYPSRELSNVTNHLKFENIEKLKAFEYDGINLGMAIASRLISYYRDHKFDTILYHNQIINEIKTAVNIYLTFKENLININPDVVYIFNGRITSEYPIIQICKKYDINYYTFEYAYTNNSYLLRKNTTVHNLKAFAMEIDEMWNLYGRTNIDKCHDFYKNKRLRVENLKLKSYTKNQIIGSLPRSFDKSKKNIIIFNSTIDEYAALEGWNNPIYEDETEGVRRILNNFINNNKYKFYLRIHPNMKGLPKQTTQLKDITKLGLKYENLEIIWPEQEIDSYKLLDESDVIITFGSTIGIEAAYWKKPSILIGHALYESLDCIYKPINHEELVELLQKDLEPLNSYSALKYANRELTYGTKFTYFKETKIIRGLSVGKFNGLKIKPKFIPNLIYKINIYLTALLNKIKKYVI
jgi:hypothetical protein